jgi:hypothetical protein
MVRIMKTISIPNSIYAAIWARATEDDETEADVLRRILGMSEGSTHEVRGPSRLASLPSLSSVKSENLLSRGDLIDARSGVIFPEGFRVFRVYKGKPHEAIVQGGNWHLDGSPKPIRSLNVLSAAIGAKTENAWTGWRFERQGRIEFINALRDRDSIHRRSSQRRDDTN